MRIRESIFIAILMIMSMQVIVEATPENVEITYKWDTNSTTTPKASICPFKYGKTWGYAIEFDDGRNFATKIALPLIEQFKYTDAPPGVSDGEEQSFVGGVAINPLTVNGNATMLTWEDLKFLESKGWGIIDHSYWHTGVHWDPSKMLSPTQFNRELFWGQTIIGQKLYNGRYAPSQLVYPNGDYNYAPYLKEYGMRYGTHVGGQTVYPYKDTFNPLRIKRNYLDEGAWMKHGGDIMDQFPKSSEIPDIVVIDFTHGIQDPETENYIRWTKRLEMIQNTYGKDGQDNMWGAPTYEILDYVTTVKQSKIVCTPNQFTITAPSDTPKAMLTVKLEGVSDDVILPIPEGGLVYRSGTTAWITLSPMGQFGAPMPAPEVEIAYEGDYSSIISFDTPIKLAAVRVYQVGNISLTNFPISVVNVSGETSQVDTESVLKWVPMKSRWGFWLLFPTIPGADAPLVKSISLPEGEKSLKKVEVWAIK